ncbi:MAG: hypothetical protein GY711_04065 [bacterium]|nr:hypothetical protein [bacterium]
MIFGSPGWILPVTVFGLLLTVLVARSHHGLRGRARGFALAFKLCGLAALLLCLTEPLVRDVRAQPGANRLLVLVDDSQSIGIQDAGAALSRPESVRALLADEAPWAIRAAQDFEVHRFAFGARLRSIEGARELQFDGGESALFGALARLVERDAGQPVAGIVLVTDGVATDAAPDDFAWDRLPPVHAVSIAGAPAPDVGIGRAEVNQTNFEQSPVTLRTEVVHHASAGERIVVQLADDAGTVLDTQVVTADDTGILKLDFDAPAEASGVHFYTVAASLESDPDSSDEATASNNARTVAVDRGSGPFRVLYVAGRPNWEFKFLRRALDEDSEVDLVALLRIARQQPKFSFRDGADRRNQLWDGFDNKDADAGEQYDEPVFTRIGTRDEFELRGGFPRLAAELFEYDALVIDDLEASFFTRDQMTLIETFVAQRGAGFLVLGGESSFVKGGYAKTPLGDLLPVYLDGVPARGHASPAARLALTREGWLEPWVRLRSTEVAERARLASMPGFRTVNRAGDVKPGGIVLVEAEDATGAKRPAFATQNFGRGRAAAMLVADLWRWDLGREDPGTSDLGTAWRQIVRWLVSDVPRRVELELTESADDEAGTATLLASVRNEAFETVDDARVVLEIVPPDGVSFELDAEPGRDEVGTWEASFTPRVAGAYRARLVALGADGSELGQDEAGWVHEPALAEFRRLGGDEALLNEVVSKTGGTHVEPDELVDFVAGLASGEVPVTEERLDPLWHRWWMMAFAILCLCAEWGVRRFHGLA